MRTNYDLSSLNSAIENYARSPKNKGFQNVLVDAVFALKNHFYVEARANATARGKDPENVGEDDFIDEVNRTIKESSLRKYVNEKFILQLETLHGELQAKYALLFLKNEPAGREGLQKQPALAEFIVCAEQIQSNPQASRVPEILGGVALVLAALALTAFAALIAASLILAAPIAIPAVGAAVAAVVALQSVSIAIPIAVAAVIAIGAVAGILNSAVAFQAARFQMTMGEVAAKAFSNIAQFFVRGGGAKGANRHSPLSELEPDISSTVPPAARAAVPPQSEIRVPSVASPLLPIKPPRPLSGSDAAVGVRARAFSTPETPPRRSATPPPSLVDENSRLSGGGPTVPVGGPGLGPRH